MRNLPREINVALIEVGDTIEVTHKKSRGLTIKYLGEVADVVYNGATRRLVTSDNATILAWEPGKSHPKVTLIKRNLKPDALFDFSDFDEIKERYK